MRAVIQRVRQADVHVDEKSVGQIGRGLVIFLGVGKEDSEADVGWMVDKIAHLRIFDDPEGRLARSLLDVGGEALVISQFTLYGDVRKGRRPDFAGAAESREAEPIYHRFIQGLRGHGIAVQAGLFGARMLVRLENDGPVTVVVDRGRAE
jgi:D-aminoacyl-tRNA deacylase